MLSRTAGRGSLAGALRVSGEERGSQGCWTFPGLPGCSSGVDAASEAEGSVRVEHRGKRCHQHGRRGDLELLLPQPRRLLLRCLLCLRVHLTRACGSLSCPYRAGRPAQGLHQPVRGWGGFWASFSAGRSHLSTQEDPARGACVSLRHLGGARARACGSPLGHGLWDGEGTWLAAAGI